MLMMWVSLHVSYPFAHQAIVERQAYELEGGLLDEVGIEDSHLGRLTRHIVGHRLPKTLCTPLMQTKGKEEKQKLCISQQ